MIKAIKIRLYPTVQQKKILNHHFGAVRYLYNLGLEYKQTMSCGHKQDRDLNAAINIQNFKGISRDELARIDASVQQAIATGRRKKKNQEARLAF